MIRGNSRMTASCPWGLVGSAEFVRQGPAGREDTEPQLQDTTARVGLDGRPIYTKQVSTLSNVILFSNIKRARTGA